MLIERVADFQNLAVACGIPALSDFPLDVHDDMVDPFHARLALIQEAMFYLTEPWSGRS